MPSNNNNNKSKGGKKRQGMRKPTSTRASLSSPDEKQAAEEDVSRIRSSTTVPVSSPSSSLPAVAAGVSQNNISADSDESPSSKRAPSTNETEDTIEKDTATTGATTTRTTTVTTTPPSAPSSWLAEDEPMSPPAPNVSKSASSLSSSSLQATTPPMSNKTTTTMTTSNAPPQPTSSLAAATTSRAPKVLRSAMKKPSPATAASASSSSVPQTAQSRTKPAPTTIKVSNASQPPRSPPPAAFSNVSSSSSSTVAALTTTTTTATTTTMLCPICHRPSCKCGFDCSCTDDALCCTVSTVLTSLAPTMTTTNVTSMRRRSHPWGATSSSSSSAAAAAAGDALSPAMPLNEHQQQQQQQQQQPPPPSSMNNSHDQGQDNTTTITAEFWIEGMTCSMCAQAIQGAVQALPGVQHCSISLTTDTATITWIEESSKDDRQNRGEGPEGDDSKRASKATTTTTTSRESITEAIESVGYSVEQIRVLDTQGAKVSPTQETGSNGGDVGATDDNSNEASGPSPSDSAQDRWERLSQRQERKVRSKRDAFLFSLIGTIPVLILTMILPHVWPSGTKTLQTTTITILQHTFALETFLLFLLATPVQFLSGWTFYKMTYFGLRSGRAGMDVLVALGTTASYGYALTQGVLPQYEHADEHAVHFFETSVTLISFVLLGKWMQASAVRRTSAALSQLMNLQAKTAVKVTPFKDRQNFDPLKDPYMEETVPIDQVREGDLVKVIRGSSIPADGRLVYGEVAIDESMVTGESMPVLKTPGSLVLGGTICVETSHKYSAVSSSSSSRPGHDQDDRNATQARREQQVGAAFIHVTGVGSQTALSQIVQLVQDAQTRSVPIQSLADQIAAVFVPFVCVTAIVTYLVWYALCLSHVVPKEWYLDRGEDAATFSLIFGVAVLVISCPCALGLATPTAVVVGTGVGAKLGVLMKGGEVLEIANSVDSVVFDKTGTLTKGTPVLSDFFKLEDPEVVLPPNVSLQEHLLWLFASLERTSEHPLAKAVVEYAQRKLDDEFLRSHPFIQPSDYTALTGRCASATVAGTRVSVGNRAYARMLDMEIGPVIEECMAQLENEGMTAIMGAVNGLVCVVMGIADELKPDAKDSIAFLRDKLHIDVWLVTGDNARTANAIREKLGLPRDRVVSEALPAAKVEQVRKLQAEGRTVAMVGDGINDSPALAQANVGISLGTGAEIAAEASDMVLVKGDVKDVCTALHLSHSIFKRIKWNFVWAMVYNCLGIPIAAGVFYPLVHDRLPPTVAALAMALSSVSVVLSSLSLRLYQIPIVTQEQQLLAEQRQRDRQWNQYCGGNQRRNNGRSRAGGRRGRGRQNMSAWDLIMRRQQTSEANDGSNDLGTHLLANVDMDQTESTSCIDNRTSSRLEEGTW